MAYALRPTLCPIVECELPLGCPIYELVDEDDISWVDVLLQGATGSGDDDMSAAFRLEGMEVGSVVHVGGHDVMFSAVPVCVCVCVCVCMKKQLKQC